ncbi:MAG TPA: hypothetical protein VEX36_06910 [Thermoleophilaceae bacterium]|nr:hypothetical protein [Thermoleophilaceae bacterium]
MADGVVKAYDLRHLDDRERERARAEAALSLSLGDLPGVVATRSVDERSGWLLVAGASTGPSLREHLDGVATGSEHRLSPERHAELVCGVADTLDRMHERGLVHRDVEPDNLLFDIDCERLLVSAIDMDASATDDRFVAPERFEGEIGPSVDQYALGVAALDLFGGRGAPTLTAPVRDVLRRATAARPAERYSSIGAFGDALVEAVAAEAPRRLSDRLAATGPAWRAGWAPAALTAVLCLAVVASDPDAIAGLDDRIALIYPLIAAFMIPVISWGFVGLLASLRGNRRRASVPAANSPRFIVGATVAIALGGLAAGWDRTSLGWAPTLAYATRGVLAPTPANAGGWLIQLVASAEHWASSRPRKLALQVAGIAGMAAALALPIAVARTLDREDPLPVLTDYGPGIAVWNFRQALFTQRYLAACKNVRFPSADRQAACVDYMRIAGAVQRKDAVARHSEETFGGARRPSKFRMQALPPSGGRPVWDLVLPDGRSFGSMYAEDAAGNHYVVMISRLAPAPDTEKTDSTWLYEVTSRPRGWTIDAFRACDLPPAGSGRLPAKCVISDEAPAGVVRRMVARAKQS